MPISPRSLFARGAAVVLAALAACPSIASRPSGRRSTPSSARAAALALAAVGFALAVAPFAARAATNPGLATFQKLIAPAAASDAAAPASGASAAASASAAAPSPASAAEIARSFDSVIRMLDNDRQRTQLVAQLKQLRSVALVAQAGQAASAPAAASGAAGAGLLGAIASGMASVEASLRERDTPLRYWSARFRAAGRELYGLASGAGPQPSTRILLDLVLMLAGWLACAALLIWAQHGFWARHGVTVKLDPNPSAKEMLIFALRRVGPWIVSFVAVLAIARGLPDSLGRTLALVAAYAIVSGSVFASLCLIMFALFSSGHRRAAGRVLIARSWRLLRLIGAFGALGDAALNRDVAWQLGLDLSSLVSTASSMTAAVLCACFAVAYRRPVAHLIRNRSHAQRTGHRATTEMADFAAALWPAPVLVLAFAAVAGTLLVSRSSSDLLRTSIVSALLLVLAFFLSAVVLRVTRPNPVHRKRRHRSVYVARLVRFAGSLATLFIWLGYVELTSRLWGISLARIVEHSVAARGIAQAVTAIVVTLFVAWLAWIVVDTAILEALSSATSRGKARNPSVRARTMLPLVRNVAFVTIVTVAAIVTAANLGINVTPLLAGAGVIGLAVGFGAQSLVSDLITGLFIIVEDTISVGDWIDVDGGHAGTVEHLTIRTVRLRDGQGALHSIPFSQIKIVKNLSRDYGCAVFEVRAPFSADLDQVTRLIRDAGADLWSDGAVRRLMLGAVEVWGLDRFEPNWMIVKGQIRTRPQQQSTVMRAFNARIKRRMDDAGIEIPLPQMHVYSTTAGGAAAEDATREDARDPARDARDDMGRGGEGRAAGAEGSGGKRTDARAAAAGERGAKGV
ncbi:MULTISPECIES: mechanosensitive ion channel family protein [Burkholderia]|uniref:Mechanosensitive ion channel protein MscS n=1 Tax=Burkholderia savannae TaxID=1637837 RepID=A0ABR5TEX1_9BURK|nr:MULTISPECIES: mechanosensitive ion channel family protein [Burkholderia]KGS05945.1 mechanosensitive ion channel family protein [Burkholderia sp. ABCPW 111]KWZ43539.1 mechanosensitive ion channel protein MscS [Burkholderia savannae]